jgi:hypothetical protein
MFNAEHLPRTLSRYCRRINPKLSSYSVELKTKILTRGGVSYTYFDQARGIRE